MSSNLEKLFTWNSTYKPFFVNTPSVRSHYCTVVPVLCSIHGGWRDRRKSIVEKQSRESPPKLTQWNHLDILQYWRPPFFAIFRFPTGVSIVDCRLSKWAPVVTKFKRFSSDWFKFCTVSYFQVVWAVWAGFELVLGWFWAIYTQPSSPWRGFVRAISPSIRNQTPQELILLYRGLFNC